MSQVIGQGYSGTWCFPRVSGDEPHALTPERLSWLFSLRERG